MYEKQLTLLCIKTDVSIWTENIVCTFHIFLRFCFMYTVCCCR